MFKLTRSNLASLQTATALEDLCKTFQDAVRLAHRFGIKYLWVDSLCIIQDDEEDWSLEAGKMSIVYGQSILHIAATGATDGSKGLHSPPRGHDSSHMPGRDFQRHNTRLCHW
jgi:Heterokaryon incompatibility protein (HET)